MAPPIPTLDYERSRWALGDRLVACADECGAGPLAGAVVACAAVIRPDSPLAEAGAAGEGWREALAALGHAMPPMRDSKTLSERQVEAAAAWAQSPAARAAGLAGWALGSVSARGIDQINIRRARALAMDRALTRLERQLGPLDHVVIDGTPLPLVHPHAAVVGGDRTILGMAIASAIGKWFRDVRHMGRLAAKYPAYGWAANAGYGAPVHLAALDTHGVTPHHRASYAPIRDRLAQRER